MSKLYEIDAAILEILSASESGELEPYDIARLDSLSMERTQKFENICKVLADLEKEKAGVQAQLDRLEMAKRQHDNNIRFLKEYVKASLVAEGRQPGPQSKLTAGTFNLRLQNNGGKPAVVTPEDFNPEELPTEFRKVTYSLDHDAILFASAHGKPIPPGIEIKRGFHLRIT